MQSILSGALMAFFLLSSGSLSAVQVPTNFAEVIEVTGIASTAVEYPTYSVRMTGYNAVPEQTNADPLTTASGAYSHPEVVVARSRDLAEELPYGTIIEILAREENKRSCGFYTVEHLIGYRVVADTMHPRKTNQIDVMFEANDTVRVGKGRINPALVLGVCTDIEIRVVGFVDIKDIPRSQLELVARIDGLSLASR